MLSRMSVREFVRVTQRVHSSLRTSSPTPVPISCTRCLHRQLSSHSKTTNPQLPFLSSVIMCNQGQRAFSMQPPDGQGSKTEANKINEIKAAGVEGTSVVGGDEDADKKAAVNTTVKVKPITKKKERQKTDFSKEYKDNIYKTTVRSMQEFELTAHELDELPKYRRRSPYPDSDDITVFYLKDLEKRALQKWGSMDVLQREKAHKRNQIKQYDEIYQRDDGSVYRKGGKDALNVTTEKMSQSGSGKVVLFAIVVNGANAVCKLAAWMYTGSHSMFAEFLHSLADTANQIVLAVGINQSLKKPDLEHPYGWSNFRNVASLISGVGIFCVGAGVSFYHGLAGLLHPTSLEPLHWALAVLAGSFISEGATLIYAIREVRSSAKLHGLTVRDYIWRSIDPSTSVVLLEDAAAVLGVTIAASCMGISYLTANPFADAIGSLLIGTLLGGVASVIIYTNTISLVGRSIHPDKKLELMKELENDRMIRALHDVKATDMGGAYVRFKAEVDFDGREISRMYLEKQDLDLLLLQAKGLNSVEDLENFMLKHGEKIVDTLGQEVDRIEKTLKKKHPEVRHMDLENL